MDKIRLIMLLILVSYITACDKSYNIDEEFIVNDYNAAISSVNGFVPTENGIFIYGNSEYFNQSGIIIPKRNFYGLLKLTDAGTIDSNFKNPFTYPVSIHKILKLLNKKYLVFYKKVRDKTKIEVALMNDYGELEKIDFELSDLLAKSVNQDLIAVEAVATDSSGNIYFSLNSQSSDQASLLIKLTSFYKVDKIFQNQISNTIKIQEINQIQIDSDENMIILGGRFVIKSNSSIYKNLCKIDINGNIDEVFCRNLPKFETNDYNRVYVVSLIDTLIYIGGNFTVNCNNNDKISNFIKINKNGTINIHQPNKNDMFKFKDEEPYFNKTSIFSIIELKDSLLLISGIFNYINKDKVNLPITLIRKNGNQNFTKFNSQYKIFYIKYVYVKNIDTLYIFGNDFKILNSTQPLVRLIRQ